MLIGVENSCTSPTHQLNWGDLGVEIAILLGVAPGMLTTGVHIHHRQSLEISYCSARFSQAVIAMGMPV